jgi:hypothetical protein
MMMDLSDYIVRFGDNQKAVGVLAFDSSFLVCYFDGVLRIMWGFNQMSLDNAHHIIGCQQTYETI